MPPTVGKEGGKVRVWPKAKAPLRKAPLWEDSSIWGSKNRNESADTKVILRELTRTQFRSKEKKINVEKVLRPERPISWGEGKGSATQENRLR